MRIRPSARLLVVNDEQRVLLFKIEDKAPLDPKRPDLTIYWATPGGGVEAGETYEEAALRELWEETGIRAAKVECCLWHRDKVLSFPDESVLFKERFFLVRVTAADIGSPGPLAKDDEDVFEEHWWSITELLQSNEVFIPAELPGLLASILAGEIPPAPIILPA